MIRNKIARRLYHYWLFVINFLVKIPLGLAMSIKLNVRFKNLDVVYKQKPPYLVLPNHVTVWDPFILSWANPIPIRWVAADANFRDNLKIVMRLVGAIPKAKDQSDLETIKQVKTAVEMKSVAGIFPEGAQNWDGRTLPLIPATAKLVRFLKVPVVVPLIRGGYLSKPRWSWHINKSRYEVDYRLGIDAEEIKAMSLSQIEERLQSLLAYDEYEWQRGAMVPLRGEKRAEHLELALWTCPSCDAIGAMSSAGNVLSCDDCGYAVTVDRYGFLEYPESGPSFASLRDWDVWQQGRLEERFREKLAEGGDPLLLADEGLLLLRSVRRQPLLPVKIGDARLYRDRLEFGQAGDEPLVFPLRDVLAENVFKQHKFEFRYEKAMYRFRFPGRSTSGLKWMIAIKTLRSVQAGAGED